MQSPKIKKGGNSNLIDCNAIVQNIIGGNSNLINYNAIAQNKKGRQLQFNRLQCNCAKIN
jgi:hypothetical protein